MSSVRRGKRTRSKTAKALDNDVPHVDPFQVEADWLEGRLGELLERTKSLLQSLGDEDALQIVSLVKPRALQPLGSFLLSLGVTGRVVFLSFLSKEEKEEFFSSQNALVTKSRADILRVQLSRQKIALRAAARVLDNEVAATCKEMLELLESNVEHVLEEGEEEEEEEEEELDHVPESPPHDPLPPPPPPPPSAPRTARQKAPQKKAKRRSATTTTLFLS